jgi:predicted DNA-binding ribbon-helix-helix protein
MDGTLDLCASPPIRRSLLIAVAEEGLLSPVVEPPDPDTHDLVKGPVRLPRSWWVELDDVAADTACEKTYLIVQLIRWSLKQPSLAPLPESPELLKGKQSSIRLTQKRWDELDAEAKRRGYSRNKVFQAHLRRALDEHHRERPKPTRAKR